METERGLRPGRVAPDGRAARPAGPGHPRGVRRLGLQLRRAHRRARGDGPSPCCAPRTSRPSCSPPTRCCTPATTPPRRRTCPASPRARPSPRWPSPRPTAAGTRPASRPRPPSPATAGRIDGTKIFVLDGHTADLILVAARTDAGVEPVRRRPATPPGLTRTPLSTMDQTRKQAKLEFAGTPATLIGTDGAGWAVLERVLDLAAVALAAEQVGGAQKVPRDGRASTPRTACSSVARSARSRPSSTSAPTCCSRSSRPSRPPTTPAGAPSELNDELPSVASLAKAYCSEAYFHAAAENIQIHGGIGFTWEHPAHLYFKRAKSSELLFGDPTYHRELLAQRIGLVGPNRSVSRRFSQAVGRARHRHLRRRRPGGRHRTRGRGSRRSSIAVDTVRPAIFSLARRPSSSSPRYARRPGRSRLTPEDVEADPSPPCRPARRGSRNG